MKRKFKLYGALLSLLLLLLTTQIVTADTADFAGGDGTPENPYQITTKYELDNVRNYPDSCFILMNDIVFDDADFEEGGDFYNYYKTFTEQTEGIGQWSYDEFGWVPIWELNGTFDGNGYSIKNIKMSQAPKENMTMGFFIFNNGIIKDLSIVSADYFGGPSPMYAGIITYRNKGTITDCFVDGKLHIRGAGYAGGIAAKNYGVISRCTNNTEIYVDHGEPFSGGIASENYNLIEDCVNTGFIHHIGHSIYAAAGICNKNDTNATLKNCVNYGPVVATDVYTAEASAAGITPSNLGETIGCVNVVNSAFKGVTIWKDGKFVEEGDVNNILLDELNKEDFAHLDFNDAWVWHSEYLIPVLNNSFSEKYLKSTTGFLDNTYNLKAYGRTYKSITVSWDKVEGASGYIIYRADLNADPYGQTVITPTRQVKVIDSGEITTFNDSYEIDVNSQYRYDYKILPYFEKDGVRIYGIYGGWASANVVDTNSSDVSADNKQPVINDIKIETTEVYRPGSLKVMIDAYDEDSDIKEITIFGETVSVSSGKQVCRVLYIPVSSQKEYGKYSIGKVTVTDAAGNELTVDGEFFDNSRITIKEEFDIEFTGALSNSNVAAQLSEMEEGKTVVLKIDEKSQGLLKKEVLDAIKGQDKTVVVYVDEEGSVQWVFYGKSITGETKDLYLDMEISRVDGTEYGASGKIIKLEYAENGILPGDVDFRLKSDYIAALYQDAEMLYLYYDNGNELELESSECPVIKDGSSYWCYMNLTHNSSFYLTDEILKAPIAKQAISLSETTFNYSGTAKKPEVTITGLVEGTDYNVRYENNKNAGTGKVIITGIGEYAGTITKTFTIKPAKITKAVLSATSFTYNGSERKPTVTVKAGTLSPATKITKDTANIDLTYASGRKNAGTYKIIIKGKGNYTGTITKTFTIKPVKITSMNLSATSFTYNGKTKKPAVTVKAGTKTIAGKTNKDNSNIDITYASGCKNVGTYKVTVKGKGNYTGTLYKTFKINPKGAASVKIVSGKKQFKVTWSKPGTAYRKQISGYQVRYATTTSKLKSVKPVTIKGSAATGKTIKNLSSKKTYYVQVRTHKTVNGTNYYSGWSTKKSIKTK